MHVGLGELVSDLETVIRPQGAVEVLVGKSL
jgi:hypothetical protein